MNDMKTIIEEGNAVLGIELGSTRIKAVLLGEHYDTIATGNFGWENHLENNIWTYPLEEVWRGVQAAYRAMADDVFAKCGVRIKKLRRPVSAE